PRRAQGTNLRRSPRSSSTASTTSNSPPALKTSSSVSAPTRASPQSPTSTGAPPARQRRLQSALDGPHPTPYPQHGSHFQPDPNNTDDGGGGGGGGEKIRVSIARESIRRCQHLICHIT